MASQLVTLLFLLIFSFSLITFCLQRLHLLSILLLLETSILILTTWTVVLIASSSPFFLIFLLTPAVCEATLGLALFVVLTRNTGNDLLKSLNLVKW